MRQRGTAATVLTALGLVSTLVACSGGGGGGGSSPGPIPTNNPTQAPTQSPTQSPTTATATAQLPPSGLPYNLPSVGGAGGTIVYPAYVASKSVVNVTYTTTLGAGSGAPQPFAVKRATGAPFVIETEQIAMDATVSFGSVPGFALTLPTGMSNAGPFALEAFDQTAKKYIGGEPSSSVNGSTVTFSNIAVAFSVVPGHTYAFEVVGNASLPTPVPTVKPTVKPTVMPTPTMTPTTSPSPTPSPTASPTVAPSPQACETSEPDPHVRSIQLTGQPENVHVPCTDDFAGIVSLPKNNGGGSSPITLTLASSTDKPLGAPSSNVGTPILYTSYDPNFNLVFSSPDLGFVVTSPSKIVDAGVYAVNVFSRGVLLEPTIANLVPSAGKLTFAVALPGGHIGQNVRVQVVVYRTQ